MPESISDLQKDLKKIRQVVREMLVRASTVDDRIWLLEVLEIIDRILTGIASDKLTSRNDAIKKLVKDLTDSGNDLKEVQDRAKKLASRLKLAASQIEALMKLVSAIAPAGS